MVQDTWLAVKGNPWVKEYEGSHSSEIGWEEVIRGFGEDSSSWLPVLERFVWSWRKRTADSDQ